MNLRFPFFFFSTFSLCNCVQANIPEAPRDSKIDLVSVQKSSKSTTPKEKKYQGCRLKLWDFQVLLGRSLHHSAKGIMAGFGIEHEQYFGRMGVSISVNGMGSDYQYYFSVPRILWKILISKSDDFSFSGGAGFSYGFSQVKYNPREVVGTYSTRTEYDKYRTQGAIFESEIRARIHFHEKIHGIIDFRCSLPITPSVSKPILSMGFGISF